MLPGSETLACTTADLLLEMNHSFRRKSDWFTGRDSSLRRLPAHSKGRPLHCPLASSSPSHLGELPGPPHPHARCQLSTITALHQISGFQCRASVHPSSCSWTSSPPPPHALEECVTGEAQKGQGFCTRNQSSPSKKKVPVETKRNMLIFSG